MYPSKLCCFLTTVMLFLESTTAFDIRELSRLDKPYMHRVSDLFKREYLGPTPKDPGTTAGYNQISNKINCDTHWTNECLYERDLEQKPEEQQLNKRNNNLRMVQSNENLEKLWDIIVRANLLEK